MIANHLTREDQNLQQLLEGGLDHQGGDLPLQEGDHILLGEDPGHPEGGPGLQEGPDLLKGEGPGPQEEDQDPHVEDPDLQEDGPDHHIKDPVLQEEVCMLLKPKQLIHQM